MKAAEQPQRQRSADQPLDELVVIKDENAAGCASAGHAAIDVERGCHLLFAERADLQVEAPHLCALMCRTNVSRIVRFRVQWFETGKMQDNSLCHPGGCDIFMQYSQASKIDIN
jgi:hypothetical protein